MNACPASVSSWVRRILPLWSPGIVRSPDYNSQHAAGPSRWPRSVTAKVWKVPQRQSRSLGSPLPGKVELGVGGPVGPGAAFAMPRGRAQAAAQQHQARGLGAREGSRRTWRTRAATKPGATMRHAMAEAAVGDDDYGTDPTIRGHPGSQAGRGSSRRPQSAVRGAGGKGGPGRRA